MPTRTQQNSIGLSSLVKASKMVGKQPGLFFTPVRCFLECVSDANGRFTVREPNTATFCRLQEDQESIGGAFKVVVPWGAYNNRLNYLFMSALSNR